MGLIGYSFTQEIRRVFQRAREAAMSLSQDFVGTEHLLLALLREPGTPAMAALLQLGVDVGRLEASVRETIPVGDGSRPTEPDLPYSARAKKVLELAMAENRELSHSYVGTEHLLLGLLREERGIGAQALQAAGVTLDAVRSVVRGPADDPVSRASPAPVTPTLVPLGTTAPGSSLTSVQLRLEFANGTSTSAGFSRIADAIAFLERADG